MTNHHRHATVAGATRRWLAALVVLLLALGSPLAAWAAGSDEEPDVAATEAVDEPAEEPAEEPPAEEPPAEEPPAEEPPAEEPEPAPEAQPEPPPSPEPPQNDSNTATKRTAAGDTQETSQADPEPDEPGATSAGGITPTLVAGNPSCPAGTTELKVDGEPSGMYSDGTLTVTASVSPTPEQGSLTWSSNIGLDAVIVKGGSNASVYTYSPESTADSGLTSPFNPNNQKYYGISHVSFCYDVETTIEVVKDLVPSDDEGLFNLRIDGTAHASNVGDGGTTGAVTVTPGSHTVSETAGTGTSLDDYTSSIQCLDAEQNVVASGSGTSLDVTAKTGDAIVCTITNTRKTGELEVVKDLIPSDDSGLFNLRIDGSTEKADASDGDTTGKVTVNTGTHSVSETAGTGTSLDDYDSSIECRDEGGQGDVVASGTGTSINVDVDEDDDIVCVITNTRKRIPEGTIELRKNTEPDGAGLFNLFIKDDEGATIDSESDVGDGTTGENTVSPGTYEVSETAGTGTSLDDFSTSISCVDAANGDAPVTATQANGHAWDVDVADEQDVVCTITNTRETGELEVIKDLEPNDDPGLFDLQIDGSTEFDDASDGDTTGAVTVNTGTHTVGEIAGTGTSLDDYDSSIECRDEDGAGDVVASASGTGPLNVEVGADDDIVCVITNERQAGELEVIKDLEPNDDPGLFDLQIDGSTEFDDASDGDTTGKVTVETGTHTVGEVAGTGTSLDDYASDISCVDEGGAGAEVASMIGTGPLDVEVGADDDIVCTITNTFIAVAGQPIITVEKTNDANGDGQFRNRERGVEGDPVTFKVVIRNVSAVPVVIDEITDTFGGQTIDICPELIGTTLDPGESVTCFFTLNDYVPTPGEDLENTVIVRGHSAEDETQTVEVSDDSVVSSVEVLGGITDQPDADTTDEGGTLAFTGAELMWLALMALALILAGTPLVMLTRRRGESPDA